MIFSKFVSKKLVLFVAFTFCLSVLGIAQKGQRVAYIDMEYILENVPEYKKAEQTLNSKILKWRSELDKMSREIEKLKTDLSTEREILTASLIEDKEDEITLKQKELRKKEDEYFGANGSIFLFRKRIIYPVQDVVYNAVQEIAKRRKYDFVLDKSSDLIMLYSNKKYDISELVLQRIGVNRKRENRGKKKGTNQKKGLTDAQKKKIADREAALKKKNDKRLAQKKKIEELRAKRKAAIEAKRALLRKKKKDAQNNKGKNKDDNNN